MNTDGRAVRVYNVEPVIDRGAVAPPFSPPIYARLPIRWRGVYNLFAGVIGLTVDVGGWVMGMCKRGVARFRKWALT